MMGRRPGARVLLAGTLLAAAVAGGALPALAQTTATDAELEAKTRQVASELRCPTCQGLSIEDSPSELARQMRATVREQLAAGRTPEQVKAYFVRGYGEWILLKPEPTGFNLFVYLLPPLALLGGLAVIAFTVRRWMQRPAPDLGAEVDAAGSADSHRGF
ncbi:MAG: cytochrome c-type biogenesis protein [Longimicrobiales bacterium]